MKRADEGLVSIFQEGEEFLVADKLAAICALIQLTTLRLLLTHRDRGTLGSHRHETLACSVAHTELAKDNHEGQDHSIHFLSHTIAVVPHAEKPHIRGKQG